MYMSRGLVWLLVIVVAMMLLAPIAGAHLVGQFFQGVQTFFSELGK